MLIKMQVKKIRLRLRLKSKEYKIPHRFKALFHLVSYGESCRILIL